MQNKTTSHRRALSLLFIQYGYTRSELCGYRRRSQHRSRLIAVRIQFVGMPSGNANAVQLEQILAHRIDLGTVDRADSGHLRTISSERSRCYV